MLDDDWFIEEDMLAILLVRVVGLNLEDSKRCQVRSEFKFEGIRWELGAFVRTQQVVFRVYVLKDDFRPENDFLIDLIVHDQFVLICLSLQSECKNFFVFRGGCHFLEFIMYLETASGENLEKRFSVVVNGLKIWKCLVINIAISKSREKVYYYECYPLAVRRPFLQSRKLPWTRTI